jgi:hypothetical protein
VLKLYGPPLAPPVELSRWILSRRRCPHEFHTQAAALSAIRARWYGHSPELPLLLTGTRSIGNLRPSFAYVTGALPDAGDPNEQQFDRQFTAYLFDNLFSQAVRTFYFHMLPHPEMLKPLATSKVPRWHALFIHWFYGLWRDTMWKGLNLDAYDPPKISRDIAVVFDEVARRMPAGQRFFGGDTPNIEDIVFAVMASPVLLPPGHPVQLPDLSTLPPGLGDRVRELRGTPAGKIGLDIYAFRAAT